MYTLYKFHFLNGISEINQLFDDILIIWPAPVYIEFVSTSTLISYFIITYIVIYVLLYCIKVHKFFKWLVTWLSFCLKDLNVTRANILLTIDDGPICLQFF